MRVPTGNFGVDQRKDVADPVPHRAYRRGPRGEGEPLTRGARAAVLFLCLASPLLGQDPPPTVPQSYVDAAGVRVNFGAGAWGVLGSSSKAQAVPALRISVRAPMNDTGSSVMLVHADFTGLPGQQAIDTSQISTFNALEFSLGFAQRFGNAHFSPYVQAGFASRLPSDPAPREKAARWLAGGVWFDGKGTGSLYVGIGLDQRLGDGYQPAVTVTGRVRLWVSAPTQQPPVHLSLVGSAVLGFALGSYSGGTADLIRLGVVAGVGK